MKKILFAIAITMMLGLTASAQGRDGFFNTFDNGYNNREVGDPLGIENPGGHGLTTNTETPLGSGLLVLTALGAGYAVARKRKK